MTYIIIACVIVAAGAIVEGLAYIFTAKMLKKREEGLDRRQDAITEREDFLDCREAAIAEWEDRNDSRELRLALLESRLAAREKKAHHVCAKKTVSFDDVFHESIGGENVQRSLENHVALLKGLLLDVLYDHITVKQFNPPESDEVELTAEIWILEEGE